MANEMHVLDALHPAVRAWFESRFAGPTEAQARGWPEIVAGRDTLIAAPTGSGKTLAAFLVAIDRLLRRAEQGPLEDAVEVVYVSPLKALSNDIQRNLEQPLAEIAELALELGYASPAIRTALRTGDTTSKERQEIVRRPPHILITTPESLYLMLTAERSREILRSTKTVIVDEIHALLRDKRGSHLALTLARLDHVCSSRDQTSDPSGSTPPSFRPAPLRMTAGGEPCPERSEGAQDDIEARPARIGLSATVRPIEDAAAFLVGVAPQPRPGPEGRGSRFAGRGTLECAIVDAGHQRDLDLAIEAPPTELEAVCSGPQWGDIYDRLAALIREHKTTLVFVNTRRLAERLAHNLSERLGEEHVAAHHGSLSKERRLALEQRLKAGEMQALVATASLELGIDIGAVDLVCQLESPRSVTTFLQRVGRSGHALGLTPKGRLFPTTRDELIECGALVRAVRSGRLDRLWPPVAPLDILAQQIVAECACESWDEDALFDLVRQAWPYAALERRDFDEIVELMSEGIQTGTGKAAAYLHRDRINNVLRGRRGARLTAIQCGGAIPDVADYRVLAEPDGIFVGTLDEDFAIESMAGDIFLLGTTSWRIRRIEAGVVRVEDAQGAPPTIPFWLGEAPSRTAELSEEVSALRRAVAERLDRGEDAIAWAEGELGLADFAAEQVVRYVRAERDSLGVVPSDADVVFERFFDDSGGMQLVVHAPFGGRINRGLGLALRKNFCRTFDFELQAAASDDAVLLSVGPQHSFPLDDMFSLVRAATVQDTLTQALLAAPMFNTRWRWNATRALAVLRQRGGKRVPPPIQRMRSADLMASVFPRLVGCQENQTGDIELPDHPLVRQTVHDCLHEAMDLDGLRDVLGRIERGEVRLHARDTTEPSPFAHEILTSKPYTYLDNAPLEERRARAITLRRTLPEHARDLGELDDEAIARVREEAWPQPRDAEEVHDALLGFIAIRPEHAVGWEPWFDELVRSGRAAQAETVDGERLWAAAEGAPAIERLYPDVRLSPLVRLPPSLNGAADEEEALLALLRGHVECLGPVTADELAERVAQPRGRVASGLARLEGEGAVLRGHFRKGIDGDEFCDRRLLARIHRYTLDRLRREIEPVSAQDFLRFLLRWQHVAPGAQLEGKRGLLEAVTQLQGFEAPAVAWERHLLPARVAGYRPAWLDELCLSGDAAWARLSVRKPSNGNGRTNGAAAASSATLISLARRGDLPWLMAGIRAGESPEAPERGASGEVLALLRERGALFYDDIVSACRRLPQDVERGLWELVARGLVTADGFQALRSLMGSARRKPLRYRRAMRSYAAAVPAGRWSTLPEQDGAIAQEQLAERWAEQLLFRYGVIFRDLLQRESMSLPWRDVLRALRRMEARGLVRGGRFVAGFYGEQYARPEAVESLRRARRTDTREEQVLVSAVDPLNLVGILTPGGRVPAVHTNVVLYQDGLPGVVAGR